MRVLDLDALSVKNIDKAKIISKQLELQDCSWKKLNTLIKENCKISKANEPIVFELNLKKSGIENKADEESLFISIVNIAVASFLSMILVDPQEKREREARLDVPDVYKEQVHASSSSLKRVVNYKTVVNEFNLIINFNDELHYQLV